MSSKIPRLGMADYPKLLHGLQTASDPQRQTHLRNLCRTDLYFLLRYVLKRTDMEHPWLFARCREVEETPNGMLDLWSREHYKSTVITFGKTIQDVLASHGENPLAEWGGREVTIGIFSHTRPAAKGFLRQIKRELEANNLLKELFPDVLWANPHKESPKWSEDDGIVVRRKSNPKEATIEAWGLVDGQPIGMHYLILNYDDVVTAASVYTPEMIQKTTSALELSYNLGADGGFKRFIGTRYHFNDSYKTILDRGTAKPRIYPATTNGEFDGDPVLWTKEKLAEKRRDMGPYTAACFAAGAEILMADWTGKDVSLVSVGDGLIGYRFPVGKRTFLDKTKVIAINKREAETYRFTFASGRSVVCTRDHKFYTGRRGHDVGGTCTHKAYAQLGHTKNEIGFACSVYDPRRVGAAHDRVDAAWLGGLFDGEGSVGASCITLHQSHEHNPEVCARIEHSLISLGFDAREYTRRASNRNGANHKAAKHYSIRGGREEAIRFLRICNPARKHKIAAMLGRNATRNFGKGAKDALVSIEPVGKQTVYTIQTDSGNYVADGYAVKNCQLMQNPKADETQGFKREWLKHYFDSAERGTTRYILVDAANGKRPSNDYTSMWVIGLGEDKNYYVLDMVRDRLNLTQRTSRVIDLHKKWKPIEVRYERYGMMADIDHIKAEQARINYRFDVVEVGGTIPKNDRIKRLIPIFEQGKFYFPLSMHKTDYQGTVRDLVRDFLEEEYAAFPVGIHDDMLDALARIAEPDLPLSWPMEALDDSELNPEWYPDI